jgi:type I restriction enzyme S subunit
VISSILDNLFDQEEQSKETAERVIDQIDTMKKSILARAFRGELGTNDPADESAEELLKGIL